MTNASHAKTALCRRALAAALCLIFAGGCGSTRTVGNADSGAYATVLGANLNSPTYPIVAIDREAVEFSFWSGFSDVRLPAGPHEIAYLSVNVPGTPVGSRVYAHKGGHTIALDFGQKFEIRAGGNNRLTMADRGRFSLSTCNLNLTAGTVYDRKTFTAATAKAGCPRPYYGRKARNAGYVDLLDQIKP